MCGSSQPSGVQLQSAEAHCGDSMVLAGVEMSPSLTFSFISSVEGQRGKTLLCDYRYDY